VGSEKVEVKQCAMCHGRTFKRGSAELRRTVDGVTFEAKLPASTCKGCGEAHFDAAALERFELGVAAELARLGRCTPPAFRFMRKALGLSGVALAELLGVEPETISRWENGARALDRSAFALLGGLVAERIEGRDDTRARLEALRKPLKKPKSVVRVRAA
jgi:putative zinc finger/helix-turn-helix YgiT family protein